MYGYVGNDPINFADPSGRCPNCLSGAIGAGIGGGIGLITSIYSELTDDVPGARLGNIAKSTGKGIAVGAATGFAGPTAGAATAAVLGGADGAITTAIEGGSTGEIVASGLGGALVEGGATVLGGAAANKLLPPSIKQNITGEVLTLIFVTGANAGANQAPGVIDAVSNELYQTGQAIDETIDQLLEKARRPDPIFDR